MEQKPQSPENLSLAVSQPWYTRINLEVILFAVILVAALFTRFYILGDRVMSHDESLHTKFSYDLYKTGMFQHTPLMHGPILFHMTALSYYLFGDNDFASRIYPALLGVILVLSPWLFRRWLGRWGTIIASTMLLISPIVLYYNRYIRHDTPSVLTALLMLWAIMMYLNGPINQRRRAHWLYIISAAMLWNLGSKETAFIYVFIFGVFLFLYWLVRVLQDRFRVPGKTVFYGMMMSILTGGVFALGLYNVLDIVKFDLFGAADGVAFSTLSAESQTFFFLWLIASLLVVLLVVIGTLAWTYWKRDLPLVARSLKTLAAVITLSLVVGAALVVVEELSYTQEALVSEQAAEPAVPGEEGVLADESSTSLSMAPMVAVWLVTIAAVVFLVVDRQRFVSNSKRRISYIDSDTDAVGQYDEPVRRKRASASMWVWLDKFPEFDLIVLIGTLILPWATAIIPYAMGGSEPAYTAFGNTVPEGLRSVMMGLPDVSSVAQVGRVLVMFMAWLPLMILSITIGLMWNWKRWLISAGIFYALFAFFFTTVFTNVAGLATGMVYSLDYWLEQQGVRRGSQPQYYYTLIIMPVYEFLPIIGSVVAMVGGYLVFWRQRSDIEIEYAHIHRQAAYEMTQHNEPVVADVMLENADVDVEPTSLIDDDRSENREASTPVRSPSVMWWEHDSLRRLLWLDQLPFLLIFAWIAILNLVAYSLAGEKMPWLGMHLTMPLIFLTAWVLDRIVKRVDWSSLAGTGWPLLILMPLLWITFAQVIGTFIVGDSPFSGLTTSDLRQTYSWFLSLIVFGVALVVTVAMVMNRRVSFVSVRCLLAVSFFVLLGVITARAAWMASFINYDLANEFLVYAHSAPAVKDVLADIDEVSFRTTGGRDVRFAYDNTVSWPYSWYFRDYPNAVYMGENPTLQSMNDAVFVVVGSDKLGTVEPLLEGQYYKNEYIRMWWPMQDYFGLTAGRVDDIFDTDEQSAQIRAGLFDIWWDRDFTRYGAATNQTLTETTWPVNNRMLVFVRKDVAAQIWEYGVGDASVLTSENESPQSSCYANWVNLPVVQTLNVEGSLRRPVGVDVAPDRMIYVAEEGANRISVFDADGTFDRFITGSAENQMVFERPNDAYVNSDNELWVVDTWNHRVQRYGADGNFISAFGQQQVDGFEARREPVYGLWGPRNIVVEGGRAYVMDTGNKRVRVYDITSEPAELLFDIGSGGSGPMQLNEPVGLVVDDANGLVYIGDTWNRRVSVFTTEGTFVQTIPVAAWYTTDKSLPYIGLDQARGLLYVPDPDTGRVLVYTTAGDCVGSFGKSVDEQDTINYQIGTLSGIDVDAQGRIYIADAELGQVLVYEPFQPGSAEDVGDANGNGGSVNIPLSFPDDDIVDDNVQSVGEGEPNDAAEDANGDTEQQPAADNDAVQSDNDNS